MTPRRHRVGMTWRVAASLNVLLDQLNAHAPNRDKAADGSIGDAAHQNQGSASDHNPWYGPGIVTARDFTHDPAGGLDCHQLAAALEASRDPRIKYMIWQGRIMDSRPQFSPWTWKPSSGHYHHLHLSVMPNASADDTRPWALDFLGDDMSAAAEKQIAELHASVSNVYKALGRDWSEVLIALGRNFPAVDNDGMAKNKLAAPGTLTNALASDHHFMVREVLPALKGLAEAVNAIKADVAELKAKGL